MGNVNHEIEAAHMEINAWLSSRGFVATSYQEFLEAFTQKKDVPLIKNRRMTLTYDSHRERVVCATTGIVEIDDNFYAEMVSLREFNAKLNEICERVHNLILLKERNDKRDRSLRAMQARRNIMER